MYEQSHRDYLRSGYLHHRLPAAAKTPSTHNAGAGSQSPATKMPEN